VRRGRDPRLHCRLRPDGSERCASRHRDSGDELAWLADALGGGELFVAGPWIVALAGLVALFGPVGFYDALEQAGPVMIVAPVAAAVGVALVTVSHALPTRF
jgi:hypothetical protein